MAGIPLMLPYSGYLLGASEVLKLAGGLGDALFDGRPAFSITETLNFGLPGRPLAVADHWLLTHNQDLDGYSYDPQKGLVDAQGSVAGILSLEVIEHALQTPAEDVPSGADAPVS